MKEKSTFSLNLARMLRETKAVKKDFAEAVGVSPTVISHWLSGDYAPRDSTLLKIADFFKVPLEELTQAHEEKEELESIEYWRARALASEAKLQKQQPRSIATPEEIMRLKEALKVIVDVVAELIDEKANSNRNI